MAESLEKGHRIERDSVETIADGIATRIVGEQTFEVISDRVDEVVTVSDSEIAVALTTLLERSKTLVEGAGAVALAASSSRSSTSGRRDVIVPALCGGNIDLNTLTNVVMRGLVETGRYLKIRTVLQDRPGARRARRGPVTRAGQHLRHRARPDRRDVAMSSAEVELDRRPAATTTSPNSSTRSPTRGMRSTCSSDCSARCTRRVQITPVGRLTGRIGSRAIVTQRDRFRPVPLHTAPPSQAQHWRCNDQNRCVCHHWHRCTVVLRSSFPDIPVTGGMDGSAPVRCAIDCDRAAAVRSRAVVLAVVLGFSPSSLGLPGSVASPG